MKKIKSILLLSAVFSLGVFAQDSAEVSDSNVEEIIKEKKQKINIEKFKKKEIELRNAEQDIIKKKNILSKEEFDVKARALNEQMKEYNIMREKTFSEFEENKKKKLNQFLENITPLIENFVKENSISIVLNQKNLFIASKNFDITDQIIQIVNENIK